MRGWLARAGAVLVSLAFLSACSGSAGHSGVLPGTGAPVTGGHKRKALAHVRIHIPAKRKSANPRLRHMQFISTSTNALQVQIYTANSVHSASTLIATSVTDLSATSSSCTVNTDGSRTCTFTIPAPAPADDFVFTTWDLAPVSGAIPGGAKQLAAASLVNQAITAGQANTLNVTLGGIVSSLQLSLPNPTVVGGVTTSNIHGTVASTSNVGVNALDADGNVIVSDGYVDASGNAVNVSVSVTPYAGTTPNASTCGSGTLQAGAGSPGSSVSLSQPASAGVTFAYGASAVASLFTSATACTFAIAASAAGATSVTGQFALLGPEFTEYWMPTANSQPYGITSGPDGNLWFTEQSGNKIGTIPIGGGTITEYPITTGNSAPGGIVSNPSDGDLWFTEYNGDNIGQITTGGSLTERPGSMSGLQGIAVDASGNLWFTACTSNSIGMMTTGGAVSAYPVTTLSSKPYGIASGSDGNMWFTELAGNKIGKITSGGSITEYALASGSAPAGIASGPDRNLWFTEYAGNKIGTITTGGAITEYAIPTANSNPYSIASGPDGNLWFTEFGTNKIGRITTGGTITEYTIPTAGSGPYGITGGSDGNVWFTEFNGNQIGRFSW